MITIPSLAMFSVSSQVYSQVQFTSLSTTTTVSTLTIGTTTLAELTTSSYGPATGMIPPTYTPPNGGPMACFYVPYAFHVNTSTQKLIGTISTSRSVNFYIMTKPQYDAFVAYAPPCGSSYQALKLEYSITSFNLDWAAPAAGDYYIMLENTSKSVITYTIQLGSIQPSSNAIYSTVTVIQLLTFSLESQINATTIKQTQSTSSSGGFGFTAQIAIALAIVLIVTVLLFKSKSREMRKRQGTRVY